jgi:hypothetical protein
MVEYLKAEDRIDELVKLNLKGATTAKKPAWVEADLPEPEALLTDEDLAGI